jgi:hypothetical protein
VMCLSMAIRASTLVSSHGSPDDDIRVAMSRVHV